MQFDRLSRREFITLLTGSAAAAWPLAAGAQQPAMPVIGYLSARSRDDTSHLIAAFQHGLAESGYLEGRNVTIEYHFAIGQYDRLPAMAMELVWRPVAVIAATGGEPAVQAAKAASSTIPIVFATGVDPVKQGRVASFNRPGGNITGIVLFATQLEPKRIGLLRDLAPHASTVGILLNPSSPTSERQLLDIQEAARHLNLAIHVLRANTDREIDLAFETITQQRIPALVVAASSFFDTRRDRLVALTARNAVPTMFQFREFVEAGGLMSYGADFSEAYRQVGVYTGRVLKGASPGDLPIIQATKFEFVINLKTARALGVKVSDNLLSLADKVIE
jgi:putative tryptophan/tyrosine transport system substrate-binding protein